MERPPLYGAFHIFFIILSIVAGFLIVKHCAGRGEAYIRRFLLIGSLLVIILEVYKQINFSFGYDGGKITFDYQWYAFPFQFCSTPMYIGLLAGLTRKGKIHNAAMAYLATYAVFAGVCVMLYPATVFISTMGINIQTMVCHGSMIAIGVYLLYCGYVKIEHKTVLRAIPVFAVCVAVACVMNEVAYRTGLLERETFDMFFISPYGTPSLPVYSLVQNVVPFPWCLVIYVAAFTLAAYLMLLIAMGIKTLAKKKAIV